MDREAISSALRALGESDREVSYRLTNNPQIHIYDDEVILPQLDDLAKTRAMADEAAAKLRFHNERIHKKHLPKSADQREIFNALETARDEVLLAQKFTGAKQNLLKEKKFTEGMPGLLSEILWKRALGVKSKKSEFEKWVEEFAGAELAQMFDVMPEQEDFAKASKIFMQRLEAAANPQNNSEQTEGEGAKQEAETQFEDAEDDEDQEDFQNSESFDSEKSDDENEKLSDSKLSKGKQHEAEQRSGQLKNYEIEPELAYKTFTSQFDEIVSASELASFNELGKLRDELDRKMEKLKTITNRLASRLQQLLMAPKSVWWEYDQEDGYLDPARYARLISNPMNDNIYKVNHESDFKDTVVTLLVDNSGSMRGRPIVAATACADILARVLEQCGVKVEILGFTTAEWKGGDSRKAWVKAGAPANPGRLNDLRHIIYKSADTPWRRAKRNLALSLKEGILKENIDGEAIQWASGRLYMRPEQRKILMVISDGAPVDDSTISSNESNYLDNHLRQVIADVEGREALELLAIGIGHDVTRYYKNAVTIADINDLGETMINKMEELFGKAA